MRRIATTLFALLIATISWCQNATLRRGSNLRRASNTSSDILENLRIGDSVSLITNRKRLGYYHVRAQDGTPGWVWAKNLNVGTSTNSPASLSLTVPAGLLAQLAAAIVAPLPRPLIINGQTVCGAKGDATQKKYQDLDSEKNRTDIPDSYIALNWDQLKGLPTIDHVKYEGAPVQVEGFLSSQIKQESAIVEPIRVRVEWSGECG